MKKTIVIGLLVLFMFLVSCAPQITNEELEAELAKLTPEQREELLADLESKGNSAFAGQAVRQESTIKYGISKAASTAPTTQIKTVVNKLLTQTPTVADTSVEGKAAQFCNKPENAGKKTHYCSEFGNTEIKYDRFRCARKYPIHVIDTTYKKSLLYPEVDTCQEILGTFLDQPDYATVGCYDSDGGGVEKLSDGTHPHAAEVGYVEIIQLQTGNKAPTALSAAANPIKELDACSGVFVDNGVVHKNPEGEPSVWNVGCHVGYYGEGPFTWTDATFMQSSKGYYEMGFPPPGYVDPETPCLWYRFWDNPGSIDPAHSKDTVHNFASYGAYLYERKCPALFENPSVEHNTKMFHCGYETGFQCFKRTCDASLPAKGCKGDEKCKKNGPWRILVSTVEQ